jgi:hypothetical protein
MEVRRFEFLCVPPENQLAARKRPALGRLLDSWQSKYAPFLFWSFTLKAKLYTQRRTRRNIRGMAQAVRACSVFQPSGTKCTLLQQCSQVPTFRLVRACYIGDEATVHHHLQGDYLNLDYQVSQLPRTLSSMRFISLRCSVLQFVRLRSSRSAALTAHSCMCIRRCLCHGMANRR